MHSYTLVYWIAEIAQLYPVNLLVSEQLNVKCFNPNCKLGVIINKIMLTTKTNKPIHLEIFK